MLKLVFAVFLGLLSLSSSGTIREERDLYDDAKDQFNNVIGGRCLTDDQCSVISHCVTDDLEMTCKLTWWFILVCAVVALLILSSIVSCLCCPCCFLYNCGKSICDCLCCCCPDGRGRYSRP